MKNYTLTISPREAGIRKVSINRVDGALQVEIESYSSRKDELVLQWLRNQIEKWGIPIPKLLIVDLFCGAGGTTIGFTMTSNGIAKVIAAVNHDPKAIESHWANHPEVQHFEEDIRTLDLTKLTDIVKFYRRLYPDAKVGVWGSLPCPHFSGARGGKPMDDEMRTMAWSLLMKWDDEEKEHYDGDSYMQLLNPDFVMIENVREFKTWGPLKNGRPAKKDAGREWIRWRKAMCKLGYRDEWKEMNSADFGARTSRNRLFGMFARPDVPIVWPEQTHAKNPAASGFFGGLEKWLPCRPCLNLDEHGSSIFTPGKITSDKTFERIYAGLVKYVAGMGMKEFLSKYYSGNPDSKNMDVNGPSGALTTIDHHSLVQADFLMKYNSTAVNGDTQHCVASLNNPSPVIPVQRQPNLLHVDMLTSYYGASGGCQSVDDAAPTITTKDRFAKIHAEWLDKGYSGSENHQDIDRPAGAITGSDKYALMKTEWLDRQFTSGGRDSDVDDPAGAVMPVPKMNLVQPIILNTNFNNVGQSTEEPLTVITANRKWHYLMNPQYFNNGSDIDNPCFTLIARMDKAPPYLVVTESGHVAIEVYETDTTIMRKIKHFMCMYGIMDIKMRMLKVVELKRIQGFPEDYILKGTQGDHKKFIGNSVVPHVVRAWAEALVVKIDERQMKAA